jgi:class 3 adenylate cyclase
MDPKAFHRKLAAILSADVAGYSRLMQDDEAATFATVEACKQIFSDLIKQHRCRGIGSSRDPLLTELFVVAGAVPCVTGITMSPTSSHGR